MKIWVEKKFSFNARIKMKIAITGKMCSGKTFISNLLAKKYKLKKLSFGGKIKELAQDLFGMNNKDRLLLQSLADKMKEIDNDVWVKYITNKIGHDDNIIIDDLRFYNELKYLRNNGFTIIRLLISEDKRIERLKTKYRDNYEKHLAGFYHNSEKDILSLTVDLEINSDESAIKKIILFLNQTN